MICIKATGFSSSEAWICTHTTHWVSNKPTCYKAWKPKNDFQRPKQLWPATHYSYVCKPLCTCTYWNHVLVSSTFTGAVTFSEMNKQSCVTWHLRWTMTGFISGAQGRSGWWQMLGLRSCIHNGRCRWWVFLVCQGLYPWCCSGSISRISDEEQSWHYSCTWPMFHACRHAFHSLK